MPIWTIIKRVFADEQGATAIEYGLIAALVALSSIGAMSMLADENNNYWGKISQAAEENMGK